jgi:hypothetical protein
VAPALNRTGDVGNLSLHPFILGKRGSTNGLLFGEILEGATADKGIERFDHHKHLVDFETESVDGADYLTRQPQARARLAGAVFDVTGRTLLPRLVPSDAIAGSFSILEALMDAGLVLGAVWFVSRSPSEA